VEVERCTDADQHRRRQSGPHPLHPELLARLAGADPHDLGARAVDFVNRPEILFGGRLAERRRRARADMRRRERADDLEPREARPQRERQSDERSLAAPSVEVHPRAPRRRPRTAGEHQVRAVDPRANLAVAVQAECPDERLTVRKHERRPENRAANGIVLLGEHDEVHRGRRHVAGDATSHGIVDYLQDLVVAA
jgi:hypothetical protein